ncbi:hypothetical protein P3T22_001146 [Paraburkholderia sp. GAS348]
MNFTRFLYRRRQSFLGLYGVVRCVTCGLLTLWLQSDARRAFGFAREKGFVKTVGERKQELQIAEDCPKRWLVILHIELNPAAIQAT